jgi:hypothetical protein
MLDRNDILLVVLALTLGTIKDSAYYPKEFNKFFSSIKDSILSRR